ncbi:Hypothetical predicted protein [Mytilus galloprovincialis]|uniref:Ig-like domain-containing protein n=1 Tax=Mytilus galloprovincialis TaxID=29158 RepID=A0A8B6FJ23_MYTGA|nr:Hypothetical predicted protein [Mytilus galloprovincialis]
MKTNYSSSEEGILKKVHHHLQFVQNSRYEFGVKWRKSVYCVPQLACGGNKKPRKARQDCSVNCKQSLHMWKEEQRLIPVGSGVCVACRIELIGRMKLFERVPVQMVCHAWAFLACVLEWTVIGKVTNYGQNVTLFCNVTNCCPEDSGWDRWTPVQRTLFIDVRTERPNRKYDGYVLRNGYTLVIQNLTKEDLNVSYSCLYGFTSGERKFLFEDDVFTYITTTEPNNPTGNSSFSR